MLNNQWIIIICLLLILLAVVGVIWLDRYYKAKSQAKELEAEKQIAEIRQRNSEINAQLSSLQDMVHTFLRSNEAIIKAWIENSSSKKS